MKTTRFLDAQHIRGGFGALLLPLLLMTAGCDEKFGLSIYKSDSTCDSGTSTSHAAAGPTPVINMKYKNIDRAPCTGSPVKLLSSGIRTAGYDWLHIQDRILSRAEHISSPAPTGTQGPTQAGVACFVSVTFFTETGEPCRKVSYITA